LIDGKPLSLKSNMTHHPQ
jgi:hypothetical protein